MRNKRFKAAVGIILMLALIGLTACQQPSMEGCLCAVDETQAQAYQTDVYLDSGGDKLVVASGGEIETTSGATTDVNSTSDFADTATFSKGSGNAIVVSAGGTVEMPATSDISLDGYMNIGDGTPDGSVTAGNDEELYVEGGLEVDGELEADGAIDADSTLNVAGKSTFSGIVDVGTIFNLTPGTNQTIVDGTLGITPTNSIHNITAAGAVGNTLSVTGFNDGDYVILRNVGSNTITITDTGTTMLSANWTGGQYDTLTVVFDGTNWIEFSRSDN